ncbi:TPA: 30S ribosomal protein S12 methylthiotransferase RimO [Legionella pneumophila]|uniref:Ribosomal protein uS12 methylthiotransferase RimO n=1 Tax=Legionella pneumophila subsp. pneumophila (strain Philadelphia 1 / ATCC 33152 / DSM 7513) TaxID=272624 RepID=RIMO_LEGPH|nr:30S ribosomal protein S12 methylthiotransferase RimO [Legionella pneumophila]Q5ZXP6.1 RecName: Full=Ribosomal protein uS12 methylthiotransferase RimO; Short=uS12 MTTase; Short=uS12 methylthiotransferase; AltName: Full=Ribosomal protein uS12 (aspartate-C(3))-methylthiotransferase; AltName: Full=Ribosome maturation factor RimO [Legionella pneumophila subsp. pneumophila str. Philadelphia 1]AAU26774.1 Fe-S oxidoreductase [Legionella pneumophila subsp. pneumophila str. Philadelphia 1]AOU03777.1 ri
MNHKVGFVSLGCPKALVDSERIITQLKAQGYELVPTYQDAGVVVINTCGFIDSAVQESLDTIKEAMAENGRVIVTGCLGAKADVIKNACPDVLHISGAHAYEEVVNAVHQYLPPPADPFTQLIPPQGIKLTPRHYAYLKISEGCNQKCTFCIIPTMRGKLQSYPMAQILTEAKKLKQAGVKELLVISQDTSAYGVDTRYQQVEWQGKTVNTRFYDLCEQLGELGIWVRLHYVYPYPHVDDIVPLMRDGLILPYLDIPLQHANSRILKAMKRPASSENTLLRIASWREICPDITLRSTFIVGFPGETEEEFSELLAFLKEAQLDRVGCFKYSPVEGAKANDLDNPVSEDIKEERYHRFMQVQAEISRNKLKNKIGSTQTVLIDEINDDQIIARSKSDAPEIDGLVYLPKTSGITVGSFAEVVITDSDDYDLYASLV